VNCAICKTGQTRSGYANVVLQREKATVVLRHVPADVCDNCGEYYLASSVAQKTYEIADSALSAGVEVEIRQFAA
jgi:YgiT-type zinc finger domain-containing protein